MKPSTATAATSAATAGTSPIEANQVDALLALDQAMETVAARVTPSIVNVAVTSKVSPQQAMQDGQDQEGGDNSQMQQFSSAPCSRDRSGSVNSRGSNTALALASSSLLMATLSPTTTLFKARPRYALR